jgi:hypothetical protein
MDMRKASEFGTVTHTFPVPTGTLFDFCKWLQNLNYTGVWYSVPSGGGGCGTGFASEWAGTMFKEQKGLAHLKRLTAAHIHFFPEDVDRIGRCTLLPIAQSMDQSTEGREHIPWPSRALQQVHDSPSTGGIEMLKKARADECLTPSPAPQRRPPLERGAVPPPLSEQVASPPGTGNFAKLDSFRPGYHFLAGADVARLMQTLREHATSCCGALYLPARDGMVQTGFECAYHFLCNKCKGTSWRTAPGANSLLGAARAFTGIQQRALEGALRTMLLCPLPRSSATKDGTFARAMAIVVKAGKEAVAQTVKEAEERGWTVIAYDATHPTQRDAAHTVCTGIDIISGKVIYIDTITEGPSRGREQIGLERMLDQLGAISGLCIMAVSTDPCGQSAKTVLTRARKGTDLHNAIISLIDIWHDVRSLKKSMAMKSKLISSLEAAMVALVRLAEKQAGERNIPLTHRLMRECFATAAEAAGARWRAAFGREHAAAAAATAELSSQYLDGKVSGDEVATLLDPCRPAPSAEALDAAHRAVVELRAAKAGGGAVAALAKLEAVAKKKRAAASVARSLANKHPQSQPKQVTAAKKESSALAAESAATAEAAAIKAAAASEVAAGTEAAAAKAAAGGSSNSGSSCSDSDSHSNGLPSLASWRASKAPQGELKVVIEALGGSVPDHIQGASRADELRLRLDEIWPGCNAYTAGTSVKCMLELAGVALSRLLEQRAKEDAAAAGGGAAAVGSSEMGGEVGAAAVAALNETLEEGSKVKSPKGAGVFTCVQDVKDRCKLKRGKNSVHAEQLVVAIRAIGFDAEDLDGSDHGSLSTFLISKLSGSVADEWVSAAQPAAAAVAAQKQSFSRAIVRLARDTNLDFPKCSMPWKAWRLCEALMAAGEGHLSGEHARCGSYAPYAACVDVVCPHGSIEWAPTLQPWVGDGAQSVLSRFSYQLLVLSTGVVSCAQKVVLSPANTACVESFNNCIHLHSGGKASHRGDELTLARNYGTVLDFHEQKVAKVLTLGLLVKSKTHPGGLWRAQQDLGAFLKQWQVRSIEELSVLWAAASNDPLKELFVAQVAAFGRADDERRARARTKRECFVAMSDKATRAAAAGGEYVLPAPRQGIRMSAAGQLVVEEVEWAQGRKQAPMPLVQLRRAPARNHK